MFNTLFIKAVAAFLTASLGATVTLPFMQLSLQLPEVPLTTGPGIQRFASCTALKDQISKAPGNNRGVMYEDLAVTAMPMMAGSAQKAAAPTANTGVVSGQAPSGDYSQTNVQVQGVDEADIVKVGDLVKDGYRYVYHLTKNRLAVSIVEPADKAAMVRLVNFDSGFNAQDLYVQGDRVMVVGTKWDNQVYPMPLMRGVTNGIMRPWRGQSVTVAKIFDAGDPKNKELKELRTVEFDGSISSSRMINGMVYLVMNASSPWDELQVLPGEKDLVPAYHDSKAGTDFKPMVGCADVSYFDVQPTRDYLAVASLPMSGTGDIKRAVVLGSSETVYASLDNLYVARQDWYQPPVRDSLLGQTGSTEKTAIYKFALKDGQIAYQAKGTVPGTLLNQFSLDENDGNLRVATTKGQVWDQQNPSTNNVYVLGSDLKQRGKIEGIAPGEKIYSIRFMGARGYMVTFKKVDPFFVLDLKNPDAPKILGKLKIPGFSDYLHPMDENHIIGVGKNADDAAEQSFAWYQGMKIAVFDVTDVANPKEMWKTEIGDRGTDSPALQDHKAFLYSPEKQILALPIRLAELSSEIKNDPERQGNEYGDFTFQGVYVYKLTLDKGFQLIGRITHHEDDQAALKSGYYWGQYDTDIQRVLYVGDTLLTVSNDKIGLNHLFDLKSQGSIDYPQVEQPQPEPGPIMY